MEEVVKNMPGNQEGPVPVVHLYGVTKEGNSVLVTVHGFLPYFFVPAPAEDFGDRQCDEFRRVLNVSTTQQESQEKFMVFV